MISDIWMRAAEQIRSAMSAGDPSPELAEGLVRFTQSIRAGIDNERAFMEAIALAFPAYGAEHAEACVAAVRDRIAALQSASRRHRHSQRRIASCRRRPADPR